MKRNFEIVDGIYLVHEGYELDLHNNFDFTGLEYSVEKRTLILNWKRSNGDWVNKNTASSLSIEFFEVGEFRFMPRDSKMPFAEDDCINTFGYWVDEEWADGVVLVEPNQEVEPHWLTAIDFMSGATIALQAEKADVTVFA